MKRPNGPDPSEVSAAVCVASNLRRISRMVTQAYEDTLRPSGVTISQFSTLGTIYHMGKQPIHILAEALEVDRTTLARNLKPLERDGYVIVQPDEQDRRVRSVQLTEAGVDVLEMATPLWKAAQTHFVSGLGDNQHQMLMEMIAQLQKLASEMEPVVEPG